MSSEPEPGHCGLLRNPPPRQDGSAEFRNLRREPQMASPPAALRSAGAMIFRPWRKTAVGNIRDNNAAWVAGPSRICFVRLASAPAGEALQRATPPSTSRAKIKFDLVRSGPVPAKVHPDSRDRRGLAPVPASVWAPGRGTVAAGAADRLAPR